MDSLIQVVYQFLSFNEHQSNFLPLENQSQGFIQGSTKALLSSRRLNTLYRWFMSYFFKETIVGVDHPLSRWFINLRKKH